MRANDVTVHIAVSGQALCRPRSWTARANSADCSQCNQRLDRLLDMLLRAIATGEPKDRERAASYAGKLGFDLKAYAGDNHEATA